MSGLSSFGVGFVQGREDLRVRKIQDEDRAFVREERVERRADRAEDRQFRQQEQNWRGEDRSWQQQERQRQAAIRERVAKELGVEPEVFQATIAKAQGELAMSQAEWEKTHGNEERDLGLQAKRVGISAQQAAMGDAAYNRQRRATVDGREDQQYQRQLKLQQEADARREILPKITDPATGKFDAETALKLFNESEVFDPGGKVNFVTQIPGKGLYIESDPDEDGDFELQMIPEDNVQDFITGLFDSEHYPKLAAQRRAAEIQAAQEAKKLHDQAALKVVGGQAAMGAVPEEATKAAMARTGLSAATGSLAPNQSSAQGDAAAAPYPEGTQLTGPDGRVYIVKNGQPVPMQ